ncbi:hypothetical protein Rumeso_04437 [Rubellimicrobium mesophilum DSM 19309]|uniref:Uncharacterized protein n=1 Tax=Rubellimicrobium mesophilum DSM 19309 TaxID=442562 RepID=A0A017HIA7_9RHOB|nr:hypothetical protein [Rubellimicrobium mesophilum]EYD74066.1 hypothetical protein Rumeso_04437 [Rubellimicrobium mesophilum DSM 19309]
MKIYESSKFHFARTQYRAEVGGFTVLRLTYGRDGGAIKTATARDDSGKPVYPDQKSLILAMKTTLEKVGGLGSAMVLRVDSSNRVFGEFTGTGRQEDFLCFLGWLATEIGIMLELDVKQAA